VCNFKEVVTYSSIPGNRNWQIETADWNLDVRLDILGGVKKLYVRLEILFRNWLAGSKTVVSVSRDATVANLERVNIVQEQVAVTLLDPRNMPDLNCIPAPQHDQAWALLRAMVIIVIDEVKNSDASTDVNDSIEDVIDFLVMASAAAAAVNSLYLSSAEIAYGEIKIWKTRTVPFPKDKNPLDKWRRGTAYLFPWLGVLPRRVLAIPATSAVPERLFSTAGNVMTKKRSRLTCDNMKELFYLHEVRPQVREWETIRVKKMHSA